MNQPTPGLDAVLRLFQRIPVRNLGQTLGGAERFSRKTLAISFMLLLLLLGRDVPSARAAVFFTDFGGGLPSGARFFGGTRSDGSAYPQIAGGVVQLTYAEESQQGSLVLSNLDAGGAVSSFSAAFQLWLGGGTGGEGVSLNFGSDLPDSAIGELGAGTGLSVSFLTADNGAGEVPQVVVKYGGAARARRFLPRSTLVRRVFVPVRVVLEADGTLDVVYGGETLLENIVTGYVPTAGRFAWGARTSSRTDEHQIDDVAISTSLEPRTRPVILGATPQGSGANPTAVIRVQLQDGAVPIRLATVVLNFDGLDVTAQSTKDGASTTVEFDPPGLLASGSTHRVKVRFADESEPPVTQELSYEFSVARYETLPAEWGVGLNAIHTNKPGFRVRVHQVSAVQPAGIRRAERQLLGDLGPNLTQLNAAGPDGFFAETGTLNYDANPDRSGWFTDDKSIPGIPGVFGGTDNVAVEILTYLDLPAGVVTLGINSDEGFSLTAGAHPLDAFPLRLGAFDGARGLGETQVPLVVPRAGVYPFRLLWFESGGGAALELYTLNELGERILVNDRSRTNSIRAYREADPNIPFVREVRPAPGATAVPANVVIEFVVVDGSAPLATNGVGLRFDGQAVAPTVTRVGETTQVRWDPPGDLALRSSHTVALTIADTAAPPNVRTVEFSFQVGSGLPQALLVAGSHATVLPEADARIRAQLESLGYEVILLGGAEALDVDANGTSFVFVSSTVSAAEVGGRFRSVPVPVILCEHELADDFLLTGNDLGVSHGLTGVAGPVTLVEFDHPLAAGLEAGPVLLSTAPGGIQVAWGVPGESAVVVATLAEEPDRAVIYAYERGATLVDGSTPAASRRVGFFLSDTAFTALNEVGLKFFEAAITWAAATPTAAPALLQPTIAAGNVLISWTGGGTLQAAATIAGPWSDVTGARSPYASPVALGQRYFRIRQ